MTAQTSKANVKRKSYVRTIYLYDQVTTEDWENYAHEVQKQLEKGNALTLVQQEEQDAERQTRRINQAWNTIESAILTGANRYIPKKKIYNTATNRRNSQKSQSQGQYVTK